MAKVVETQYQSSMQSTQTASASASASASAIADHLHCTVCGTHFKFSQCTNWEARPEYRCNPCGENHHTCPNCLESDSQPSTLEEMRVEKADRRKKMRDIPSRQCTTCSRRFSRNECTKKDTCPICLTPTAVHVSKGKLLDGETAHDYIRNYFQLLADKRLLRTVRVHELGPSAFHLLNIPLHDGNGFVIRTGLRRSELDDDRIMQRLFTRLRRTDDPHTPLRRIRVLVTTTITNHVDVFKGLVLTEENDGNHFQIDIHTDDAFDDY